MARAIKCMIVDDEEMATRVIETHLNHIPNFEIVGIYHSAVEAFLALDTVQVDILFLDIQMPKITGIDMVKMLKKKPLIVLTTAHREYALEGFDLEVVDYLLKPIGLNRFLQTISRLKKQLALSEEPNLAPTPESDESEGQELSFSPPPTHVFIKTNRAYQKINFEDVYHVEAIKNHIRIFTKTGNHISLTSLGEFDELLPDHFIRVHRSFIINVMHILKFNNYTIQNPHGEVPIGRTYKDSVLEYLKQFL